MLSYEVYKITNKVNGKVYIGITNRGAGARFKQHLFEAEHGSSFRFHNALRKYGADGFDINIISFCKNAEELKEREKFFIKVEISIGNLVKSVKLEKNQYYNTL